MHVFQLSLHSNLSVSPNKFCVWMAVFQVKQLVQRRGTKPSDFFSNESHGFGAKLGGPNPKLGRENQFSVVFDAEHSVRFQPIAIAAFCFTRKRNFE